MLYRLTTGCQWRMLPKDFPPYSTVQRFFYHWRADGLWDQTSHGLAMRVREVQGRDANSTAGIIDGQSVKATEAGGPRGLDAGKKIKGRRRHILTDTTGLLVAAIIHEAYIQDRDAADDLELLPRRLFVERTFAWLNRDRRLAKGFETTIESAKVWLMIASSSS